MNYQKESLPSGSVKVGETPVMNQETVLKPILNKHMAPKEKWGFVVVEQGELEFVWEDTNEVLKGDKDHPIVIEPERYHHVVITGPVEFKVEFYRVPEGKEAKDQEAVRPGEAFVE